MQAAEKVLREFKAVDYDVSKWDQAVDSFQGKAVQAAKETVAKIETEEKSLKETLSNISEARPFEDLTVSDVFFCFRCVVWRVLGTVRIGRVGRRSDRQGDHEDRDRAWDFNGCQAGCEDELRGHIIGSALSHVSF